MQDDINSIIFPLIAEVSVYLTIHFLFFITLRMWTGKIVPWDICGGILCELINISWAFEREVYSLWGIVFKIYLLNQPH